MRRRGFLAGTTVVAASALAGCSGVTDGDDEPDDPDEDPPARIVEAELVREDEDTEDETVRVEGVIERTRDEELSYVEVRAEFQDADGEVRDTTVEQVGAVQDEHWAFDVQYPGIGDDAAMIVDYDVEIADYR